MTQRKRKQKKMNQAPTGAPFSPSVEVIQQPAWQVTGAAVKGISHQRLNLPCQDAQGYRLLPDGTLLVALADGAGSAPFSDQGAQRAVEAGMEALTRALEDGQPETNTTWEILLRDAVTAAREAVLRLAEEAMAGEEGEPSSARAFASTLTLAIATTDRLVAGQIGDGAVVASRTGGDLFAVTHLQRGEYANETHFLTQDDALDRLTIDMIEEAVSGFAVMSDGLIRLALKMPGQEPHAPFFAPLFRFAGTIRNEQEASTQLSAFLDSERVNARTDDDKSLVLAVRAAVEQVVLPDSGE